ncbi:MAG: hypothetical protein NTZ05_21630, partial [Chloroflexi bacterium]|nr:hypothetical protein [Chloroflexota bacterium]
VRVSEETHQQLKTLASETGKPMQDLLAAAVDAYRRKVFMDQVNAGYAALRADPEAWKEELEERALWDTTLMDGLKDDPYDIDEAEGNDTGKAAP